MAKGKTGLLIGLGVAAAAAVTGVVFALVSRGQRKKATSTAGSGGGAPAPTPTPTPTPTPETPTLTPELEAAVVLARQEIPGLLDEFANTPADEIDQMAGGLVRERIRSTVSTYLNPLFSAAYTLGDWGEYYYWMAVIANVTEVGMGYENAVAAALAAQDPDDTATA